MSILGTVKDCHPTTCAKATAVANPPIAAGNATSKRCGTNADDSHEMEE